MCALSIQPDCSPCIRIGFTSLVRARQRRTAALSKRRVFVPVRIRKLPSLGIDGYASSICFSNVEGVLSCITGSTSSAGEEKPGPSCQSEISPHAFTTFFSSHQTQPNSNRLVPVVPCRRCARKEEIMLQKAKASALGAIPRPIYEYVTR